MQLWNRKKTNLYIWVNIKVLMENNEPYVNCKLNEWKIR